MELYIHIQIYISLLSLLNYFIIYMRKHHLDLIKTYQNFIDSFLSQSPLETLLLLKGESERPWLSCCFKTAGEFSKSNFFLQLLISVDRLNDLIVMSILTNHPTTTTFRIANKTADAIRKYMSILLRVSSTVVRTLEDMSECQMQKNTKKNKQLIVYLSRDVRQETLGSLCVKIHLKLTDVRINRPVTWHLNCGAVTPNENGVKPSAVIKNTSMYALKFRNFH